MLTAVHTFQAEELGALGFSDGLLGHQEAPRFRMFRALCLKNDIGKVKSYGLLDCSHLADVKVDRD